MVLAGFIKRKLESLIRPWVLESGSEVDVDVKLGFRRTLIVVRNLNLNNTALSLINDHRFKMISFKIDEIIIRLSPFSTPAFFIHIAGLNLSFSPKPSPSPPPLDVSLDHYLHSTTPSLLAHFDPQGSALHDRIDGMMKTSTRTGVGLKDSIINLLLSHCFLHFRDTRIRLHFHPTVSHDDFSWLCYSRDIALRSSLDRISSLFPAFFALLFIPFTDTSFYVQATELELGALTKHDNTSILSFVNPSLAISLQHLTPVNLLLSLPQIRFFFSPVQLQMLLAFCNLFSVQSKPIRSGRLLWKIAGFKIRNVLPHPSPKEALYKIVLVALRWLRLVKEYHAFLSLVGYPERGLDMPTHPNFLRAAQEHWQRISQQEITLLPLEAVATARRVARHRAVIKAPCAVSHVNIAFTVFWKIFLPLFLIWRAALYSLQTFRSFVHIHMTSSVVDQSKMASTVLNPIFCFQLSVGKILATLSIDDGGPNSRKSISKQRSSKTDLISFVLLAEEFLFIYKEGICEQYTSFSVGFLKISGGSKNEMRFRDSYNLMVNSEENQAVLKVIAWGEPAQIGSRSEIKELKELPGEMELVWNQMRSRFQGSENHYGGKPWAIFAIHMSLPCQGSDLGFLKSSFMVGKLNFALGYSSVILVATLMEQVQHALYQVNRPLHSSRNSEDLETINLQKSISSGALKCIVKGFGMKLFELLPDKHVEVKAIVTGPRVQLSLKKEGFRGIPSEANASQSLDKANLVIDVHDTHFAVLPTAMPREHGRSSDNLESELFRLQESTMIGFPESVNTEYVSQGQISLFYYFKLGGLTAYLEDLLENDQLQILQLKPVTAKFPSIRDYFYTFGRSFVASSLSLHCVISGATALFYVDELFVISKIVESLFTAAIRPRSSNSAFIAAQYHQVTLENQILQNVFVNEEILNGSGEGATSTIESDFSIRATVELVPFDIILHNSRNVTDLRFFPLLIDAYSVRMPEFAEPSCTGVWLSVPKSCVHVFIEEAKVKVDATVSGFHAVLFKHKNQTGKADKSVIKNAIPDSADCLYEASLSSCSITLLMDFLNNSELINGANSRTGNSDHILDDGFNSDLTDVAPSRWLLLKVNAGVVFMGPCCVKNDVLGANVVDKLQISVSVGGEFQSILLEIQGGLIVLDMLVLVRFAHSLASYLDFVKILLHMKHSEERAQSNASPTYAVRRHLLEACSIDLSRLSLVLLSQDESGALREIIGRITVIVKLWQEDRKHKFLFNLSHLEILSQYLYGTIKERETKDQLPRFSSGESSYEPVFSNHGNSPVETLRKEKVLVLSKDASFSKPPVSMESSSPIDSSSSPVQTSTNFILEQFTSYISAEKLSVVPEDDQHCGNQGWVGRGSVLGLNLTISLSEIKMLMAVAESLSEISGKGTANSVVEKTWSSADQKFENNLETALPEGAIVAIQDVHQHMYVTVESVENKYRVAGAVHYSAAGKKALFTVKWHKQKRWGFSTSWFSLVSLYAKTGSGDPLRLNYSTSSSSVDIASSNDSACALWKIASQKDEGYEDDIDLRPLSYLSRNTFYLVNKKNDCAVAFVDGAFEFVKKPGNPFKFKILPDHSLTCDKLTSATHLLGTNDPLPMEDRNISDQVQIVPCITLTVEKVSLTVNHELSDARDKLPLLQGSIDDTELIVQALPLKTRVITTFTAMLYYFDAHKYIWRELAQPIEICIYWRSTTHLTIEEKSSHGMHSRLYVKMQELDFSLTELSLDMLLYLIGKLDLAGPFAVKSPATMANCCKVENQLELDLLCQFDNLQSERVGGNLSAFFLLRHLVNKPLEASYATVSLEIAGISSTSSISVPLGKTQVFAWRTRIKSLQDTKTHPGPFIVFDISKNVEEGLSLTISPLLRIHNRTGFSMELRIQRADSTEAESASVLLKEGDTVDDCVAAFDAVSLVGGPKKALRSLGVGNFVFSFRPEMKEVTKHSCNASSVDWSDNLEGGKAVRLSGVIGQFSYQFRKVLSADSKKSSFSTAGCSVFSGNACVAKIHFLVQCIARDVPIMHPNDHHKSKISPIALQVQKEILLLPTMRVSNLLESDIDVHLSETETSSADGLPNINQATIPFGLTVDLYANPAVIFFTVTLTMFGSSCKPINCDQWLKKLNKKKDGIQSLDIDLDFCHGQYFACLRLARSEKGVLEAIVFTRYTLRNDTEFSLFCSKPNLNSLTRHSANTPPHLGSLLPPKSMRSWFMKSSQLSMKLFDEESSESTLDLDALSGRSEMSLTKLQGSGCTHSVKLGISLGPLMNKIDVPAQVVSLLPRYVVSNESDEQIFVRQWFLEDDFGETLSISSKQKKTLSLRVGSRDKRDISVFDKLLRKHKVSEDDFSVFVQFTPNESMLGWSGPVCVASLGRFFLKFKRSVEPHVHQSAHAPRDDTTLEFAAVHVVEEASTFVLNFYKPPDIALPYRIENHLSDASITYYQKDTFEPETLASKGSVYYVWDDVVRPHKLVVKVNGVEVLREISLDKLRPWKPFLRIRQRELASKLPSDSRISVHRGTNVVLMNGIDVDKLGYEVCADGPTRVLRICYSRGNRIGDRNFHSSMMIQLRVSYFSIRLLERSKQDLPEGVDANDLSTYTPILVVRLVNISLDSIIFDQRKYNQFRVQSISIDEKWSGAPFAAMLRRHLTSGYDTDDSILFVVIVLYPTSSNVREVKFSSVILQPIDLNLDEETLMKLVPFWRTSLSTNSQSQQYYFDHFEVQPVKIIASFLPEDSYSSYSSGQETLRSLLHSVIKVPAIQNLVVELNGVLVTHALVTTRELLLRCGRHYSWYAMRAIYIAKGSQLLPPSFASAFDDLASSSLDVFFDPSSSLFNVRGLTLGTFKLVSKCIENKGMSGSRRYFGDLSKTLRNAGSSILFAAVTEVTDSVLKGAESSGINGMVTGFHHGILKLAMEPSVLGTAFLEGGPDRKIKLDRSPGVDELYIEGYLQAMLDTIYKQEYLRIRVIDDQVILKNLPPNSSLIDEIMDRVKDFLLSKALLKGEYSTISRPLRHLRGENEWRVGPIVLTLCEHLFVSFAIRMLRKQTNDAVGKLKLKGKWAGSKTDEEMKSISSKSDATQEPRRTFVWRWGIGKFVLSAAVAYIDGRLCRCIPNPIARRIVSGFLLSFLDNNDTR